MVFILSGSEAALVCVLRASVVVGPDGSRYLSLIVGMNVVVQMDERRVHSLRRDHYTVRTIGRQPFGYPPPL